MSFEILLSFKTYVDSLIYMKSVAHFSEEAIFREFAKNIFQNCLQITMLAYSECDDLALVVPLLCLLLHLFINIHCETK